VTVLVLVPQSTCRYTRKAITTWGVYAYVMACYAAYVTQNTEFQPEEMVGIIQAALAQAANNVLAVAAHGTGAHVATVSVMLPNGQTFWISVEETTGR
jgi:hypothetical protein